ncbi:MAG: ammonium transporter [Acidimicrobiia bacterium]|nr:ammonium transporter [Acidimicrobiia bacterium]MYC58292.1 ammonium transporter [Acidimicrobiia bacterium]MYG93467.1 ammonium transporter [Acidimicrobiia bacterium]MYI30001.1 ammonium transporter [Acidimicrobiia bacterium]
MDADTVWVLISAALVMFMVPGLALFYGGMVGKRNMLNMMNMNLYCLGVVPLLWAVAGFGFASGDWSFPLFGDFDAFWLSGVDDVVVKREFVFGLTFAVITPALISGAVAGRMKFSAWAIFVPVWSFLVYSPVVYWIYGGEGWIANLPAHDFAGGTAIHINAGIAALALVLVLGPRRDWPNEVDFPNNLPLVLLGAGILWFGWFGFNAGSALAADGRAAHAFLTTFLAAAAALCTWMVAEIIKDGKPTALGMASGIVAGLVAITPAAGFVGAMSSIVIGGLAGVVCYLAIGLKLRFRYDDSLDVVGIHMFGGVVGGVLIGLFADSGAVEGGDFINGIFYGGGELLLNQIVSILAVMAYSFVGTFLIAWVLNRWMTIRTSVEEEMIGLDTSLHAETAYN